LPKATSFSGIPFSTPIGVNSMVEDTTSTWPAVRRLKLWLGSSMRW
jgi:hypothetical protein